ncbi:MAG TPA: NAD(P)-dependent oxidoreductase [Rhodospirillales bacterium]|nr:NAD(P)-dependent oxidoreductase [Rhodospirillales bacterium]
MEAIQQVGFVGLGKMGWPMAGHLAKAGFDLVVADNAPGVADSFTTAHGGRVAPDLSQLGQSVDAVITMLPTSTIVRDVILGDDHGPGVADGLRPGSIVIDMSTSDPVDTRNLAAHLTERGIDMIDAPVAGGVVFAKDGTLAVTAGGEDADIERCRPLLDAVSGSIFHCGGQGTGHAMKALNNFVNASGLITAFEALSIGKRFGLDPRIMLESMTAAATGRNTPIEKKVKPYVNNPDHVTGMALALLAKDVRITADMADAIGAYAPIAERCSALWTEAAEKFGAERDQIDVVRLWLEGSEVSLSVTAPKEE